jgi:hypothetical protein
MHIEFHSIRKLNPICVTCNKAKVVLAGIVSAPAGRCVAVMEILAR